MSGVPRITRRKTFVVPETSLFFDILPDAIISANGRENRSVRKKTSIDVTEPESIALSILRYLSFI